MNDIRCASTSVHETNGRVRCQQIAGHGGDHWHDQPGWTLIWDHSAAAARQDAEQ